MDIHIRNYGRGFRYIDFHIPKKDEEIFYISLELGNPYGLRFAFGKNLRRYYKLTIPSFLKKRNDSNIQFKVTTTWEA
jgi:hypothetical protein